MPRERVPVWVLLGMGVTGLAWLLAVQPYSVLSPHARYDAPAHRYLVAALERDTATLNMLAAARQPVTWAVQAGTGQRRALAAWANSARASLVFHRGDTLEVWYDTATEACPFRLTFVGRGQVRLVEAHARCYIHRGWPPASAYAR